MFTRTCILVAAALVLALPAYAKSGYLQVEVADPFIEMRTGPGRGFPVFHVADRGARIEVTRQRTEWYEVRTDKGVEGWVHQDQLARTLDLSGEKVTLPPPGWEDFTSRRWEVFLALGDFDGASSISIAGAWRMSANLSAELMFSQLNGDFSDGWMAGARLLHTPFPEWRIAPFFLLGTGIVEIDPRSSLVSSEDRSDQFGQAGVGLRAYLNERFIFRAEYSGVIVFTSRDDNEEVEEWKAGFTFFF